MPPSTSVLTWVQVCDDAVKIGLGALIGGVFALLVAKHSSKSTIEKMQFERRSRVLSEVAEKYEAFFQSFVIFMTQLSAVAQTAKGLNLPSMTGILQPAVNEVFSLQARINEKLKETLCQRSNQTDPPRVTSN